MIVPTVLLVVAARQKIKSKFYHFKFNFTENCEQNYFLGKLLNKKKLKLTLKIIFYIDINLKTLIV